MNRRHFLVATAALAAGCSRDTDVTASRETTTAARAAASAALGLQLYTVRDLMAEDMVATLELVAAVGYRDVEFAGYFDTPPADVRRHLEGFGLRAPSAHIGYGDFSADVNGVIDHAASIGHQFVVVPAVPDTERATLDDYRRHAANFNRWGEACRRADLTFGYHNHEFEFGEIDGRIPYDVLLAETDPSQVTMELDLAWARAGKADALAYFEAWPGRFQLCHIKDLDANGSEADIGEGDVAFERIFARAEQAGLKHGFVERDHPADARASIERNFAAIKPLWDRYLQ